MNLINHQQTRTTMKRLLKCSINKKISSTLLTLPTTTTVKLNEPTNLINHFSSCMNIILNRDYSIYHTRNKIQKKSFNLINTSKKLKNQVNETINLKRKNQIIRNYSSQILNEIETKPWFIEEEEEETEKEEKEIYEKNVDQIKNNKENKIKLIKDLFNNNLPNYILELYEFLINSPFFNSDSITLIDAKSEQGDAAWTDWVVLVTLKLGRESAIRGAADSVKSILEKNDKVRIEGVNSSIRNSDLRTASNWVLVDAGKCVVHILNSKSRGLYDLENRLDDSEFL